MKTAAPNVYIAPSGRYQVRVKDGSKTICGGTFAHLEDAIKRANEVKAIRSGVAQEAYGPLTEIDALRARYRYEPETGLFYYNRPSRRVHVGKVAGGITVGYVSLKLGRKSYMAHRVAWAMHHGEWPDGIVDHINRVKTDNRIENLRLADKVTSNWNRSRRTNSTGFNGVYKRKSVNGPRYGAQITVRHHHRFLGTFDTAEEASAAYERARLESFGEMVA